MGSEGLKTVHRSLAVPLGMRPGAGLSGLGLGRGRQTLLLHPASSPLSQL